MDIERQIARHKDAVYRQMLRVCGDADDAEDVLAEAMVRAIRAADNIRDDHAFRAWMTTVGSRICFRLRSRGTLRKMPLAEAAWLESVADTHPLPDQTAYSDELRACVHAALEQLSPELRAVYQMRDLEGRSGDETAAALGISIAAMKSRLHRARVQIRTVLDETFCAP
ncbi:MAG: RNA polymerase sigma factor [Fimbriimonadaceae bacterium]|nr:RNA polymerase sigma factor [Fimbriimonadaceae bacterium]